MKQVIFFVMLSLFLTGQNALATRPLSTDDAETVEKGKIEYEIGLERAKTAEADYTFSHSLKAGVLERVDAAVEIPVVYLDKNEEENENGISDIKLSLKYNPIRESDILDLSFRFDFKTDSGDNDKGIGSGDKDYSLTLIGTKEFENFSMHFNFGYAFAGNSDDVFKYFLAFEKMVNEKCNFVCEAAAETDFSVDFDEHACEGLAGFNYALTGNLTFDTAVAFGFSEASPDYKLISGLTTVW